MREFWEHPVDTSGHNTRVTAFHSNFWTVVEGLLAEREDTRFQ